MDLNILVNDSLKRIQEEGYVEEVVEEKIKKTITEIINDLFREWGPFGKNLKEELGNNLKVNLQELDLASYNHMVNNVVKENLDKIIHVKGTEKMKESLEKLLASAKDEYTLSELIEQMKADESHHGDSITLHINDEGSSLAFIYFDPDEGKRKYDCKYSITVALETNEVRAVGIDGSAFDNKVIMGGLFGLDETLFKIYTNGAKIIIDEDDIDCEYEDDEDED